jgi:hypothetical protein
MTRGIEHIVRNYVQLKNRAAMEGMREQLNRLLQEDRVRVANGYKTDTLAQALRDDIDALDEGIARLAGD